MGVLIFRMLLGAAAVLLIALLSRSRNFVLAGLVPLFPTFALIAHYIVGTERGAEDLRATVVFGLWALIPYGLYLGTIYVLAGRVPIAVVLAAAVVLWCGAALVLFLAWNQLHPPVS